MAARSTKMTVRNLTRFPLVHLGDHLDGGIWTEPLRPPPRIPAGATMWWKSESDGVLTGTEGRATYAIGDTGSQVNWHWDNPYAGLNSYQQDIGPGFGISFSEGLGDNAAPIFTIAADTPVVVPDFLPSRNALPFVNHFPPAELTHIPMPDPFADISIGNAANGLCGGMTFVTADYYHSGSRADPIQGVPAAGSPLFLNIVVRLIDSFDLPDGVAEWLKLMDPIYGDTDNLIDNGRAWYMAHVQWPQVQNTINAGHPCPINLVMVKSLLPTDLGLNHQVLVYGYKLSGSHLTLRIYDPNTPRPSSDLITMTLDLSRTDERIVVEKNFEDGKPVYCFFVPPYQYREPVGGVGRLPLSLRQFLQTHDLNPMDGVATLMAARATPTLKALVRTP